MITSMFYGLCFLIILWNKDNGIKIMAGLCLAYLAFENLLFYYFSTNSLPFDITFYFALCWALDSALLFAVACVVSGVRQKLTIALGLPLALVQVFVIQYPTTFPDSLYTFAIQDAHMYFIEVFIFSFAYKDNTIKEWIKTSSILFLAFVAHLV